SPVQQEAERRGIEVAVPESLRDARVQEDFAALNLDAAVVVAFGQILPRAILDAPRLGCLNVHASLLPRWRGAAPIQRAILAGDADTGVTIMQMDEGLDTGAMLAEARLPLVPGTSAGVLHDRLAELGPPLLLHVLDNLPAFLATATAQNETGATYARKIDKSEAALDWTRGAAELARTIAAFNPFPVCYGVLAGERVRIWAAKADDLATTAGAASPGTILTADRDGILVACGEGALRIQQLQLPGGKALPAGELLNARSALFVPGNRFAPAAAADASS
ncbi:MAG: methionyl-tRNA formyltransferase, partial [Haliea sp.]